MELHPMFRTFREKASAFGIFLDAHQIEQFVRYLEEITRWNKAVRLVSREDPDEILWLHFMDSLTPYHYLAPNKTLLDIGSGAGFPGVPLKIATPSISLHLIESQRKRVNFLKHLLRELAIEDAVVHEGRAEQIDPALGKYHTVISRAVGPPERWLSWASDLVEEGGQIVLMLGKLERLPDLNRTLAGLGLEIRVQVDLELPVVKRRRHIVIAGKTSRFT
jgi:16S rRNA (guanine527-N7)-methyltransferase